MMLMNNQKIFFDLDYSPFSLLDILPDILLSNRDRLDLLAAKYKPIILEILGYNKEEEITTSQLANKIGLSFEETHYILTKLQKEGKIIMG